MNVARWTLALLVVAVLASGCTTYYRITDNATGKTYYTTAYDRQPNNVRFKDHLTRQDVHLPVADIKEVTEEEYNQHTRR
jgi:uncharacterized protein YceK